MPLSQVFKGWQAPLAEAAVWPRGPFAMISAESAMNPMIDCAKGGIGVCGLTLSKVMLPHLDPLWALNWGNGP